MATATSQSLSYVLDEVVSGVAFESAFMEPFVYPAIYGVRTSTRRRERLASVSGAKKLPVKSAGAALEEDRPIQQFEKDFTHQVRGLMVPIEREFIEDEEWGMVADIGMDLGEMASYTIESDCAAVFNDAFAGATYTGEDAKALASNTHTNVDSGNSQDNYITDALDYAALRTGRQTGRDFTNYRGFILGILHETLLVPNELETDAYELVRSMTRPDVANEAANLFSGSRAIVWNHLTSATAWFLINARLAMRNLLIYMRRGIEIVSTGDFDTQNRKIGVTVRYSHGFRDWRWAVCSDGTA